MGVDTPSTFEQKDIHKPSEVFDKRGEHLGFLWDSARQLPEYIQKLITLAQSQMTLSENKKIQVGVAIVDSSGLAVGVHNSQGGQSGHAEVRAWNAWFKEPTRIPDARPAILAIAGHDEIGELTRMQVSLRKNGPLVNLSGITLCGSCREYWCEHTNYGPNFDVDIFSINADGSVFQTTLRTLYPGEFEPTNVKVPIMEDPPEYTRAKVVLPKGV